MIYSPNYDNGNFALAVRDRYVYTKAYAVFVCRFIYFSGVNYSKKAEMTKTCKMYFNGHSSEIHIYEP